VRQLVSAVDTRWLPGFNFNVEEWDAKGLHYETLAICRSLAVARAAFAAAVAEKPAGRFMIQRIRIVQRHPEGIGEGQFIHIGHQLTNEKRPPGNRRHNRRPVVHCAARLFGGNSFATPPLRFD
jgi:hypothetical protein